MCTRLPGALAVGPVTENLHQTLLSRIWNFFLNLEFSFSKLLCIIDFFSKTMSLLRGYSQFEYLGAEVWLFTLGFLSLSIGLLTCRT